MDQTLSHPAKSHTLYMGPHKVCRLPIADQSITDKVLINWLSVAWLWSLWLWWPILVLINLSVTCDYGEKDNPSLTPGNVVEIPSASGHQTFSSLRQILSTPGARVDFPTPPPTPRLQSGWTGDWWMVPRGILTRCSSCSVWGPLTP